MKSVLVLNVDDYAPARYAKTRLLENAGFLVREAANGADALKMAAALRPELMLLDVRLPDIDGMEVCRRIKANPDLSGINVVQTSSAFTSEEDVEKAYRSGADGYLVAPYEPSKLISVLRSLCRPG